MNSKLIKKEKMANGIVLTYSDDSKNITGDRCLVRLLCKITSPLLPWMEEVIDECGAERQFVQNEMNSGLRHELSWERNFVDEKEKDECLAELQRRAHDVHDYLANAEFLSRLFYKRLAELKEMYNCRNDLADVGQSGDEPVDFSACFSRATKIECE